MNNKKKKKKKKEKRAQTAEFVASTGLSIEMPAIIAPSKVSGLSFFLNVGSEADDIFSFAHASGAGSDDLDADRAAVFVSLAASNVASPVVAAADDVAADDIAAAAVVAVVTALLGLLAVVDNGDAVLVSGERNVTVRSSPCCPSAVSTRSPTLPGPMPLSW